MPQLNQLNKLHPELQAWNSQKLPDWYLAVFRGDFETAEKIEDELIFNVVRFEERAKVLKRILSEFRNSSSYEAIESNLEEYVVDLNLCCRDVSSLRPKDKGCRVRQLVASTLQELKSYGGVREHVWDQTS